MDSANCTDAVREVVLTQGYVAIVDEADYAKIVAVEFSDGFRWQGRICDEPWCVCRPAGPRGKAYAMTRVDRRHVVYLHRAVMEAQAGQQIDHIDDNGLNNRRQNLRFATQVQNNWNRPKARVKLATSRYKGVSYEKRRGYYYAQIKANGRRLYLGSTETEEESARLYDEAALRLFGEYARLNFPSEAAK